MAPNTAYTWTFLALHLLLIGHVMLMESVPTKKTYRAAVFEHAVIPPPIWAKTRHMAVDQMMFNLRIYEEQAHIAGKKGVDIIVFPEDGLHGLHLRTRMFIYWYLEPIPDPVYVKDWVPCDEPMRFPQADVQVFLSCLAKRNKMYVVANMGDIKKCLAGVDPNCNLKDGVYMFNTNVAYDRHGKFIARYHKQHLFLEPQFNAPVNPEYIFFDTEFGRFGMMVGNDVLFHDPGLELIRHHGVTDIAIPTFWPDNLPYYSAIGYMSSFAIGHSVNMLVANLHDVHPGSSLHGSGIFTPAGAQTYMRDPFTLRGHLLIADVPINVRKIPNLACDVGLTQFGPAEMKALMHPEFKTTVLKDWFDFVLVKGTAGAVTICQNGFCCFLQYDKAKTYDVFAFGVFHGIHKSYGQMYEQICLLTKCRDYNAQSCGYPVLHSSTKFKSFRITGNFTTPFIHPQIVVADPKLNLGLPAPGSFLYGPGGLQGTSVERPLLHAALIGRLYHKDCINCIGV